MLGGGGTTWNIRQRNMEKFSFWSYNTGKQKKLMAVLQGAVHLSPALQTYLVQEPSPLMLLPSAVRSPHLCRQNYSKHKITDKNGTTLTSVSPSLCNMKKNLSVAWCHHAVYMKVWRHNRWGGYIYCTVQERTLHQIANLGGCSMFIIACPSITLFL